MTEFSGESESECSSAMEESFASAVEEETERGGWGGGGEPRARGPAAAPPGAGVDADHSEVDILPHDVLLLVLTYVAPSELLLSVSSSNRRMAAAVRDDRLWRGQCLVYAAPASSDPRAPAPPVGLSLHQLQRCCLFSHGRRFRRQAATLRTAGSGAPARTGGPGRHPLGAARPASILASRDFACSEPRARVALATSTDRDNERVENTLPPPGPDADGAWDSIAPEASVGAIPRPWVLSPVTVYGLGGPVVGQGGGGGGVQREAPRPALPIWQEGTYWSSDASGSGRPGDTDEVLLFTTKCPLAIVSDVAIKPFREVSFFERDNDKVYSWPGLVVKVYHVPVGSRALRDPLSATPTSGFPCTVSRHSMLNLGNEMCHTVGRDKGGRMSVGAALSLDPNAPQRGLINALLSGIEPTYESPVHCVVDPNSDAWQHYPLPPLVIGNVVTFTLCGKNHRQFPTSGYYVCVDRVAARGVPLYGDRTQAEIMGSRFRRL